MMEEETAHPDIQLPIAPRRAFDAVGHQSPSQLSSQRLPPEHQEQLLLKTTGHDLCKPPKSNEVLVLNGVLWSHSHGSCCGPPKCTAQRFGAGEA